MTKNEFLRRWPNASQSTIRANVTESMTLTKCQKCGVDFMDWPSRKRKFCSVACAGSVTLKDNRRQLPRTKYIATQCANCGNEFFSWQSQHRQYCSNECSASHSDNIVKKLKSFKAGSGPQNTYSRCGRQWHEVGGKRFYSRSRWEMSYANYLQWRKDRGEIADWEYEAHTFWFEKIRRGVRSYVPDFKVTMSDGSIEWHEVKGWMDSKSKTKIKRMAIYHPNEFLMVLDGQWFAGANKTFAGIVPGWPISPGKMK